MDFDIKNIEEKLDKSMESLEKKFTTVRTGRANPSSLDIVKVEYYGSLTPLNQLATISVPEGNQLLIKPFDKGSLAEIEKAIIAANLGYNPTNDGENIRIIIPALTEERRKELTKQVKSLAEEAKISVRNIRHDAIENLEKSEISEDEEKNLEKEIQDLVNKYNKKIEDRFKEKEKYLMTV